MHLAIDSCEARCPSAHPGQQHCVLSSILLVSWVTRLSVLLLAGWLTCDTRIISPLMAILSGLQLVSGIEGCSVAPVLLGCLHLSHQV